MKAAVYARMSRKSQHSDETIEAQIRHGRGTVERLGWTEVDTYVDDGISAWKDDVPRPAYDRLLTDAQERRLDVIVVRATDPLTRNWLHFTAGAPASVSRTGAATSRPQSRAAIEVLGAKMYSDAVSRNLKVKLRDRAQQGRRPHGGRRPFGYNGNGSVNDEEARHIREGAAAFLAGEATLRGIAGAWNNVGALTPYGHEWTPQKVARVLS